MKPTLFLQPFHYHLIANVFDDYQLDEIWEELDHYQNSNLFLGPEKTGTARDENQKPLKRNRSLYQPPEDSSIFRYTGEKIFSQAIINHPSSWFFSGTRWNDDSILVSYYDHEDYYKPHNDVSMMTACIWLFKEPQSFDGGIFHFPSYGIRFPCVNNCAVVFPSSITHSVSKVYLNEEDRNKGLGRYTITQFASVQLGR